MGFGILRTECRAWQVRYHLCLWVGVGQRSRYQALALMLREVEQEVGRQVQDLGVGVEANGVGVAMLHLQFDMGILTPIPAFPRHCWVPL